MVVLSLSAVIRRWSWPRASPFLWLASELRSRFGRRTFNKRDDVWSMNSRVTAACSKLLNESDRKWEGKPEDWCRDRSCIKCVWPDRKTSPQMCFGKHSCCGYFITAPKINIPINTVQAPSNSLQVCEKEALFVNSLLQTWTETRILNTSVGARAHMCALLWLCSCFVAFWKPLATLVLRPSKHSELSVRAADVRWISDVFS